jgi:hypothetical protein
MTATPSPKPTDRVVYRSFGIRKHGRVRSLIKASAMVDFDDGTSGRISLGLLRPETPEDVEQRDHEQAMRAWDKRRPEVTRVAISIPSTWGSTLPDGVQIYRVLRDPIEMREAAAELVKLADWFAERPVKP